MRDRYSAVSITLHWLIVGLILLNIWLAIQMEHAPREERREWLTWHLSFGVTILLLTLARIGWRFREPWPALPEGMANWEKMLARATHYGFYVLLIAIPLLGWATVSANPRIEGLSWWGVIPWPKLPLPQSRDLAHDLGDLHKLGVVFVYVLLALHVAGALKHQFFNKDDVLARMIPPLRRNP